MEKRAYRVSYCGVESTVIYFEKERGVGRREPLGEILDRISNIHHHTDHEVFFVPDGEMELVLEDGMLALSDCAAIVPAGMGHYTVINSANLFVLYVSAESNALSDALTKVISFPLDDDARFYVRKLSVAENGDDCFHLISLLFSAIARQIAPEICRETERGVSAGKYTFEIDDYIEDHYAERVRLSELARHLHLCEKQVSRVIKREYGCSFSSLVNQKRLAVAAMMLRHTDLAVSDIARRVGFGNDNYFYRVFKGKYGSTPAEYRTQKNGS